MTAVFVHGVPETAAVWSPLVEHLADHPAGNVVTLGLPGFATPLPEGFEPIMESYATWLAGELAAIAEPVHLVGHDWGALLSLRVLASAPANVASWVVDTPNLDDSFVWHDLAQVWISPGGGEEFMDMILGASLDDRAAMLASAGVPASGATDMAAGFDATMASSVLSLYRSAVDIGSLWGPGIDQITGRGPIIDAADDPYRSSRSTALLAQRTGARVAPLAGCGHWWMLDDPAGAAAVIAEFWAGA
jgi:pimeloyl-ACP methyl ester carboxylesterase